MKKLVILAASLLAAAGSVVMAVPASASVIPGKCAVLTVPQLNRPSLVREGRIWKIGASGILTLTVGCDDYSRALAAYVNRGNLNRPLPAGVKLAVRPAL